MGGILIESDDSEFMKVGIGINRESNNKNGLEISGYLETIGDINNNELFNMIDLEMSSKFEEIGNYRFIDQDDLIENSWKALSKILSRGVKLTDSINDFRVVGLNKFGELEIQDGRKTDSEVVRDLFRKSSQAEQSYSERQMFQVAIERLAREVAAVEKTDYFQSTEKIEQILSNK